jgi:hypothetical protein
MFEQDRMIGRLQRRVASQTNIGACFLSGSFGRRTSDHFSDLDICLVFINEAARINTWEQRDQFAQSITPYLALKSFDAKHIRPYFHIALYANGCKLDFRYETRESIEQNPWDGQIRILKDSENWAQAFQEACSRLAFPQPSITSAQLSELDQRFWIMYWDIVRQLARGDSIRPFTIYLELLCFTLPKLLEVLPSGEPSRELLSQAYYSNRAEASIESLSSLLDGYLAARAVIIRDYSLQISINASFESEIKRLLERLV